VCAEGRGEEEGRGGTLYSVQRNTGKRKQEAKATTIQAARI